MLFDLYVGADWEIEPQAYRVREWNFQKRPYCRELERHCEWCELLRIVRTAAIEENARGYNSKKGLVELCPSDRIATSPQDEKSPQCEIK